MTNVRVDILGPFELRRDGQQIRALPKKAQALLAFLTLNRERSAPKDKVATLLWGNSTSEQAAQSLRQCLLTLRKIIGAEASRLLHSDGGMLSLVRSTKFTADTDDFETVLQSNKLEDLEAANRLFRNELLTGLSIPVEPFERWLLTERQRFDSQRIDLLHRLATARAEEGHTHSAITAGRKLLETDPLREESHRLVMRLLADAGDRGGALVQYEHCARILRQELDIAPDLETVNFADSIRAGNLSNNGVQVGQKSSRPSQSATPAIASQTHDEFGRDTQLSDVPSIVVLPFSNLGGNSGSDYLVRGLIEDLIVALGREKWLFVIATPSAFVATDQEDNPQSIGQRLGVRYVLRGSIRSDDDEVVFVTQLHDAQRGRHVWSNRIQDRAVNLLAMQERLATEVAAAMAPALMSIEVERAINKSTNNLSAFDCYLRALPHFRASKKQNEEALALLDRAIELDPNYASAHALAARCYQFQLMFDWRPPGDSGFDAGVEHGREAVRLGRNDSEALWMAGLAIAHLAGDLEHCQALIDRSLTLNPNSANAWIAGCLVHSYLANTEAAIDCFQRAQRLNPLDLSQHVHWNTVAWAYLGAGRYEEAADAAERTLRVQPDYLPGLRLSAVTMGLLGRLDEGRAIVQRLLVKQPTCSIAWMHAFLRVPLHQNMRALDAYLKGARIVGVPER